MRGTWHVRLSNGSLWCFPDLGPTSDALLVDILRLAAKRDQAFYHVVTVEHYPRTERDL